MDRNKSSVQGRWRSAVRILLRMIRPGLLINIYYGKKLTGIRGAKGLARAGEAPFVPSANQREKCSFADAFPYEYPTRGVGDYRESCLRVRAEDGTGVCEPAYAGYRILEGKPGLPGLPATFERAGDGRQEGAAQTLEIICIDPQIALKVVLSYSVFEDSDAVVCSVRLVNEGKKTLYLEKVPSACIDMDHDGYEMLTLNGSWARERHMARCPLSYGSRHVASVRGESSHQAQPFLALMTPETTQDTGDVYAMHFVYSGNFLGTAEVSQYDSVRMGMGIHVKWDMNRQLTDLGSSFLTPECQGELFHRYVLGVYRLQERLITEFPDLLFENCSGGGGRFDPGMLYYSPQIWCSDNTDAVERLAIQEGTALLYPLSAIGAHVSDCPNHIVGRTTPFVTRGHVALSGTFGYELDITKLQDGERELIKEQTEMYHKYHPLIREGDYYRIASWQENHSYDCWETAAKDGSEALVTYVQVLAEANVKSRKIRLKGLDAGADYRREETGAIYGGDVLLYAGFLIKPMRGDYQSRLLHFVRTGESDSDQDVKPEPAADPFVTLESEKSRAGRFTVVKDKVRVNGHKQPYDYLEVREGVSILPVKDGKLVIQRQYRYPVRSWQWEIPGGFVDEGEIPEEAAVRELKEETGYEVKQIYSLGAFYPSFGSTNEKIHLFAAKCGTLAACEREPGELVRVEEVSFAEFGELVRSGQFMHGAGLAAWARWQEMEK